MSRYEWEEGSISLPTAAVPAMRKALRDSANATAAEVLAECQRLWRGPLGQTTSRKLYAERLDLAARANTRANGDMVYDVMISIIGGRGSGQAESNPRMPRASDVERVAPVANSRTDTFRGSEWTIHLDGSKLTYSVGENNHACETARAHPLVSAMFRALARVTWTRGSGGVIAGNDEYSREGRSAGSGGNYITESFGPLGEGQRAYEMGISLAKYHQIMKRRPASRGW